ncbi:efflux transporter outer membrane subunit [uncultured Acinetobacter sp.]|uniref:efflux transporter outer membrane subunit n=1 Tax=uncultured Acinetobacter sp. TaxID=165433 RepID=UPI00261D3543|nr:efflux transporter outer membrane subunit [uncultured Acinetobacter sp.]
MFMKLSKLCTALLIGTAFTGCAAVVKTPYQAPVLDIPQSFALNTKQSDQIHADVYADRWWTLFNDANLNRLVEQVLASNNDLVVAGINLQQARLQAGLAQDRQGVRVNSSVSTGHNFDLNSGENNARGMSLSGGVSYEVDLFGRLASQTEAARWEALATEQDLQATAQSLIATTTQLYWQLGYLKERLTVSEQNLNSTQQTYNLVRSQYRSGAVSGLEVTQAEQAVQSQRASLSQIQQQLLETRTALAVLLNRPLQQLSITEPKGLGALKLPNIEAGLPASLLARRPDLQAAELRLRKALANKDATKASYYPSISLTGNLGTSSTSLTQLLQNPTLALGASLSLPFLQYNDMKKDLAMSDLDYEKAIVQYRQTLYQAFADVENALSNRTELNRQVALQQQNVALAEKTERLTQVRYKNGAIALKNVLDAQATTRNARLSLVQTKQSQYNAYVTLMQTLGGSPLKN